MVDIQADLFSALQKTARSAGVSADIVDGRLALRIQSANISRIALLESTDPAHRDDSGRLGWRPGRSLGAHLEITLSDDYRHEVNLLAAETIGEKMPLEVASG